MHHFVVAALKVRITILKDKNCSACPAAAISSLDKVFKNIKQVTTNDCSKHNFDCPQNRDESEKAIKFSKVIIEVYFISYLQVNMGDSIS